MMSKFRTSTHCLCAESATWGLSVNLMKALQKNCQTGPMQRRLRCAPCCWIVESSHSTMSMLLDCSFGCSLWDFVAGMLPYHCGIWVTCFFDILLKLRWTAKQQCVMLRVRWGSNRCGVRNGLWWFAGMLLRGSRYRVAPVVVRSKGCVKQ